jgi:RNA polymerase sigma-70 factor, ECF subfamily
VTSERASTTMSEGDLLAAAKRGAQRAFGELIEPYRRELYVHCYRMLGSWPDAEDALQDALVDVWKGLAGFQQRSSLRSWLYTVTTNACLKVIRRRPRKVLPIDYGPPADPHNFTAEPVNEAIWLEPYPDEQLRYEQRETIELAFIAALQHLPARQRAVLVLRDVLGFSAREVADVLGMTPPAVDSALQRAHKTVDERLPARTQKRTLSTLDDQRVRQIVEGFVKAWETDDVDALVTLLARDAILVMPPQREWFVGRDAIATFLASRPLAGADWRIVRTRANGQLAFAQYMRDRGADEYAAHAIAVLTLESGEISQITIFRSPELFARFGLPDAWSEDVSGSTS